MASKNTVLSIPKQPRITTLDVIISIALK